MLEQLKPSPACWQVRADGLVNPSLVRFDFSGICSRYIDSNAYSIRINKTDLATSHSLRLIQEGGKRCPHKCREQQGGGRCLFSLAASARLAIKPSCLQRPRLKPYLFFY